MNRLWPVLLPDLRQFPAHEHRQVLRRAREVPLDTVELLGMAAGLVLVTAATRHGLDLSTMAARFGSVVVNFIVALPLLALALGPFHVRRLRRGLRLQLDELRGRP